MTAPISTSLATISGGLKRLGRTDTIAFLQPGVAPERTQAALEPYGLDSTPGLTAVYAWHDGIDAPAEAPLEELYLVPGLYLLSLADVLANYEAFRDDDRWDASWLPILADGGGDFLAVVCDADSPALGAVVHFRIDQTQHPIEYASVEALFATLAGAFESGIYFIDDRGYFEMDDQAYAALAARMNEDVPYWRGE